MHLDVDVPVGVDVVTGVGSRVDTMDMYVGEMMLAVLVDVVYDRVTVTRLGLRMWVIVRDDRSDVMGVLKVLVGLDRVVVEHSPDTQLVVSVTVTA